MRRLIWINIVLIVLSLVLGGVDMWCDRSVLMGSRTSSEEINGHPMQNLFDGQPVVPDYIEIYPLNRTVLLYYYRDNFWFRRFPWIELFVHDGVILSSERRD